MNPVLVVDRSTGAVLRRLDPERAPLVAYPGAVLLYRGRRFSVPDDEVPLYRAGERIAADLCEDDLASVRVRKLAVTIEDKGLSDGYARFGGEILAVDRVGDDGKPMGTVADCWDTVLGGLKAGGEFVDEQDHAVYATRIDLVPGRYSLAIAMCLAEKH